MIVGHFVPALAAVHAAIDTLHLPVGGQTVAALAGVQAVAASRLHLPLMGEQTVAAFAAVQAAIEVLHLPCDGHWAAAFAGWQATMVELHLPSIGVQTVA